MPITFHIEDSNDTLVISGDTVVNLSAVLSVNGKTGNPVLNAADVGADASGTAAGIAAGLQSQINTKANAAAVNQALTTKADLVDGVIPAAQLPSYVDDVEEYDSLAEFPEDGEAGKIYVDTSTNYTYRWSGSIYVPIGGGGVALGETASTAYRGDRGKSAYDHSVSQGNPHNTAISNIPTLQAMLTSVQEQINAMPAPPVWVDVLAPVFTPQYLAYSDTDGNNKLQVAKINGYIYIRGCLYSLIAYGSNVMDVCYLPPTHLVVLNGSYVKGSATFNNPASGAYGVLSEWGIQYRANNYEPSDQRITILQNAYAIGGTCTFVGILGIAKNP